MAEEQPNPSSEQDAQDSVPATEQDVETASAEAGADSDVAGGGTEEDGEGPSTPRKPPSGESLRILEALLFASPEILTAARLKTLLPDQPDARAIRRMVNAINEQLQKERHPYEIVELGGGYQWRTIPYYHPWVQQLFKERTSRKLSIQALETLAVIAYKQPITKAEVEQIRGVVSDGAMKPLLEKRLVTIVGRSEKAGHPLLYGTTPSFLNYFGINRLDDLPKIEEFEAIARKKMEDLSEEELRSIEAMAGEEARDESAGETPEGGGRLADDAAEREFTGIVAGSETADSASMDDRSPRGSGEDAAEGPPG